MSKSVRSIPAFRSGHFEFKTLWSPTVVHLLLAVMQVKRSSLRKLRSANFRVEEVIILLSAKQPAYPVCRLLKCAEQSTFKCLILVMPLNLCLLRNMSVSAPDDLKDHNCKRGTVTQQPPISYTWFNYNSGSLSPRKSSSSCQKVILSLVT